MATTLFNLVAQGSAQAGSELWVNLGTIPSGFAIWIGSATFASPNKVVTCELRCNNTGTSTGTIAATKLLSSVSIKAGASVTQDLYKRGALHTATTKGTGAEKWWLRIASTKSTAGTVSYKIYYTTE